MYLTYLNWFKIQVKRERGERIMWVVYALLAAGASAGRGILSKKVVMEQNEYVGMWLWVLFGTVVALLYLALTGWVITDVRFWQVVAIRIVIDSVAAVTYFKALKLEEVSYVAILLSLGPMVTIGAGWLINHELVGERQLLGMMVLVAASILVVDDMRRVGSVRDRRNFLQATGLLGISVLIWSTATALHRLGISYSSPATYFAVSYVGFTIVFTVMAWLVAGKEMLPAWQWDKLKVSASNGIFLGLDQSFTLTALRDGLAAYVSAISSTGVVMTVVLAGMFLKERLTKRKLVAAGLILVGVVILAVQ